MADGNGHDAHPRGTIALVGLYAVVFVVGWFAMYIGLYLARGAVTR